VSTTTKIASAIEIAERFMSDNNYQHGACLGASIVGLATGDCWEVEFAYEGLSNRSPTTDPPSIVLAVELINETVKPLELM